MRERCFSFYLYVNALVVFIDDYCLIYRPILVKQTDRIIDAQAKHRSHMMCFASNNTDAILLNIVFIDKESRHNIKVNILKREKMQQSVSFFIFCQFNPFNVLSSLLIIVLMVEKIISAKSI